MSERAAELEEANSSGERRPVLALAVSRSASACPRGDDIMCSHVEDLPFPTAVFARGEGAGPGCEGSYVLRFQRASHIPIERVVRSLLAFEGHPAGHAFDLFDLAGGHLTGSPVVGHYTGQ